MPDTPEERAVADVRKRRDIPPEIPDAHVRRLFETQALAFGIAVDDLVAAAFGGTAERLERVLRRLRRR